MTTLHHPSAASRVAFSFLALLLCWSVGSMAQTPASSPSPAPVPTPLDAAVASETLWTVCPADFVASHSSLGFHWVSQAHDSAQSTLKGGMLFGIPVYQTIIRFDGEKPGEVTAFFYNRGDAGKIGKDEFTKLIQSALSAVSAATNTKYTLRGKDASNAVKADGFIWNTEKTTFLLEYSFTREPAGIPFRAEFLRLQMTPREKPKGLLEQSFAASQKPAAFRGPDHVVHDSASGDVAIKDIPMVDQGEKGYCVVASAERVLRYYGVRVDENELAQLANTSASEGTSVTALTNSLKKLTARLKIRVRTVNSQALPALIDEYNRVARQEKANPVVLNPLTNDMSQVFVQMKPDVLRIARLKNRSAFAAFERLVQAHVDKGIPLLWSVALGIIPEPHLKVPKPGGHMRLIIGYNAKTRELIYSDSWGIGHESKRMSGEDAWTITMGMATIEPL